MNANTPTTTKCCEPYVGMPIYLDDALDDMLIPDDIMDSKDDMDDIIDGNYQCSSNFENWPIAMAYVPMQGWGDIYEPEKALQRGTIFPCLDLPFLGGGRK